MRKVSVSRSKWWTQNHAVSVGLKTEPVKLADTRGQHPFGRPDLPILWQSCFYRCVLHDFSCFDLGWRGRGRVSMNMIFLGGKMINTVTISVEYGWRRKGRGRKEWKDRRACDIHTPGAVLHFISFTVLFYFNSWIRIDSYFEQRRIFAFIAQVRSSRTESNLFNVKFEVPFGFMHI